MLRLAARILIWTVAIRWTWAWSEFTEPPHPGRFDMC